MGDTKVALLLSLSHPLPLTCAKLSNVLAKSFLTDTDTNTNPLFQKYSCCSRCQQEKLSLALSLSATLGKVISQFDVEAEAVKSGNPAYLPLTDTNRRHISRLTSEMHQGQGLKRPVGARCIQNHVTGRSGACQHQ